MADGFIKEPAVATRKDFDPKSVSEAELEQIKLEDGVHAHENVKLKLLDYAERTGKPVVHPFMLVVAQDTTHAEIIRKSIEAQGFFGGRYKERVIRVDSALKGEESDDAMAKLVALEHDGRTENRHPCEQAKRGLGRYQPLYDRSVACFRVRHPH
jgi:type III restriction enzyme